MLYSENLITKDKNIASYNTAIKQINKDRTLDLEHLKTLYAQQRELYDIYKNARTVVYSQMVVLRKKIDYLTTLTNLMR